MILGLELRASICGWALLDEGASSFVDLGVHTLGRPARLEQTTLTRLDRGHGLAQVLAAQAPGCTALVVERCTPETDEVSLALAWGSVLGVVATLTPRPRLLTIEAQRWQREVLLGKHEISEDLAFTTAAFVLRGHPRAEGALRRMPTREREPAIAAAMIALYGSLRLAKSKRVESA